jgi:hypothetical protein
MNKTNTPRVFLASMPWTTCVSPSLGLGILKAQLNKRQIESKVRHLNLFLLKYSSAITYARLAELFAVNDFVFKHIFEPELAAEQLAACETVLKEIILGNDLAKDERYNTPEKLFNLILKLRNQIIPVNSFFFVRKKIVSLH